MGSGSKFQRQRPSELRRKKGNSEVRGEEKSRETEKAQAGPPILRAFKGGGLGGGPREGYEENIHQLSRGALSGSWSPLIGWHQGKGSLVIAAYPEGSRGVPCLVLLLFWAWS